jgi:polyhydroxybutyrate depolymerase
MSTRPRRHVRALAALAIAGSLALGACSSSGGDKTPASSGDTAATTTTTVASTAAPVGKQAESTPVPSKGCGTSTVRKVTLQETKLPGSDRFYLLTTPKEHDGKTPLPLVVDFHGLLEGAVVHAKNSQLAPFAQSHGFVVAMPNGSGTPVHWIVTNDRKGNPDLVFVDAVLDQIEAQECIDTSRVYATGLSNGAFISSTIGCTMNDRFAAIAPVSGLTFGSGCKPGRHVPVLTFHGELDPILLFNGGIGDVLGSILGGKKPVAQELPKAQLDGDGYPKNVRTWAKSNGCQAEPTDSDLTPTVMLRTYSCPADGATEFVILKDGGHTWPGTQFSKGLERIMGPTDESIDANTIIWKFFQRFALPSH